MPIYDYHCSDCLKEFESYSPIDNRMFQQCPDCNGEAHLIIKCQKRDWFREFVTDDFNGKPILVKSKEHFKELCKEHGVYSRALGPIDDKRGC
jgi:putative FmdB family regulatory protein